MTPFFFFHSEPFGFPLWTLSSRFKIRWFPAFLFFFAMLLSGFLPSGGVRSFLSLSLFPCFCPFRDSFDPSLAVFEDFVPDSSPRASFLRFWYYYDAYLANPFAVFSSLRLRPALSVVGGPSFVATLFFLHSDFTRLVEVFLFPFVGR